MHTAKITEAHLIPYFSTVTHEFIDLQTRVFSITLAMAKNYQQTAAK